MSSEKNFLCNVILMFINFFVIFVFPINTQWSTLYYVGYIVVPLLVFGVYIFSLMAEMNKDNRRSYDSIAAILTVINILFPIISLIIARYV